MILWNTQVHMFLFFCNENDNFRKFTKKSLLFLVVGWLQNWCGDMLHFFFWGGGGVIFVLPSSEKKNVIHTCIHMCMWLLEPDQISYTQSMVAKRDLTNRANVHTIRKTQRSRIPINPANFGCNWTSFHSQKNETKNADTQGWGDSRGDQKQVTFFFCLK